MCIKHLQKFMIVKELYDLYRTDSTIVINEFIYLKRVRFVRKPQLCKVYRN